MRAKKSKPVVVTRDDIEAALDRVGLAKDETRVAIGDTLAKLDGALVSNFLKRLDSISHVDAEEIILSMRRDVFAKAGAFVSNPAQHLESVLAQRQQRIEPEWHALGAMNAAEVKGLPAKIDAALESMMSEGFGYMSKIDSPEDRAAKRPAARAAFFAVFQKIDPELRGELLGRFDALTPSQTKRLVQHAVLLGLRHDYQTVLDPSPEVLRKYEDHWRKDIRRDKTVLVFEDVAGYESVGIYYRAENFDDPALVEASIPMVKSTQSEHADHALRVLCSTTLEHPAIDDALRTYARRSSSDGGYKAVLGLVARDAENIPFRSLIDAANDKYECGAVLLGLRQLYRDGQLDRLPEPVKKFVLRALKKNLESVDSYAAGWIRQGQADTITFVKAVGLVGEQTAAAITEHEAKN